MLTSPPESRRLDGPPYGMAERDWAISNDNIVEFLEGVDWQRTTRVRYEDLVHDPEAVMRQLSGWLWIGFESAMLEPYGKGRLFAGFGDPDILAHQGIETGLGEAWVEGR